ncbi:hypothetical protein [Kocuria aegyptia]|uniref:DUF4352 domain-containing protein n=1 Tax=Kocuria aegyptia TaxID=330943 RepID=A0ABP4WW84_9MICC
MAQEISTPSGAQAQKRRRWSAPLIAGVSAGAVGLVVGFGAGVGAASDKQPVAQSSSATSESSAGGQEITDATNTEESGSHEELVVDEPKSGRAVPGGWGMTMPAEDDIHSTQYPAENKGLVMTVDKFVETPTITINDSGYRSDSPLAEWRDVPPDKEGKFFVAETTIKNNTDSALDLTCSSPVDIRLLDDEGKSFGPIENLYEMQGNPECNYQLEPGFESKMNYAFAAPHGAKAEMIVFAPLSFDGDDYEQPGTGIRVGQN